MRRRRKPVRALAGDGGRNAPATHKDTLSSARPGKRGANSRARATGRPATGPALPGRDPPADALARTVVYRKLPLAVRMKLDRRILLRGDGQAGIEEFAETLGLSSRYGITPAALRAYVRRLEAVVRPIVTAQMVAGILGCLPEAYRRRVRLGSEVMLLSRLVNALGAQGRDALSTADLAKVNAMLSAAGKPAAASGPGRQRGKPPVSSDRGLETLSSAVRTLYGLDAVPKAPASVKTAGTEPGR